MSAHERFTRFTFGSSGSPFLSDSATPQVLTPRNTLESSNRHSEHGAAAAPPAPRQQKPAAAHLAHLAANLSNPVPIARLHISQLTPALFDAKFRQPGVPLVIEGAIDLSSFDWRLHSFVETFDAEATYQCRVHGGDAFARTPSKWSGKSHARHVEPTTPRKYAQTITDGIAAREDCYVQADIRGTRAGEAVEVTLRRLSAATGLQIHRNYGPICNMWWGAPGHTEPLHMDATDGTLCQLHGRKRIVLFPPSSWRDLYPFPSSETGMSWAFSQVVQSKPDLGRFPRLADALPHKIELTLDEGEVLFIPCCCAHEISGDFAREDGQPAEHVLSVNRFWRTDPNRVRPHMPESSIDSYNTQMAIYE